MFSRYNFIVKKINMTCERKIHDLKSFKNVTEITLYKNDKFR